MTVDRAQRSAGTRTGPGRNRLPALAAGLLTVLALAGCSGGHASGDVASAAPRPAAVTVGPTPKSSPGGYDKVLVVMEENETYQQVLGSARAPYLSGLAARYGSIRAMDAGYPVACPSLAAYLLLTSGDRQGICDDKPPAAHPHQGDSIFAEVNRAGRQWRSYAESMPGRCAQTDSGDFAVRHVPADYYIAIRPQCDHWSQPMGTAVSGAFRDDLASGSLPAYAMLIPNLCDDMHGAPGCSSDLVAAGDRWLQTFLPTVFAAKDWQVGRLVVVVDWDEGSATSNHIPALVLSPTTNHVNVDQPMTHCSMLALTEDILRVPRIGCAIGETRRLATFGLQR